MARRSTGKTAAKSARSKTPSRSSTRSRKPVRKGKQPSNLLGKRAIWTGNLRLALVSVPVGVYPATTGGARISFHQIHRPTGKRIRYEKVVPGIGPVDTDEIVSGFEIDDGRYVLLDEGEIDEVRVEARKTVDLVQFVGQSEIDPIWFDRPYYVVPDGELAEEAYGILRDALRASKRIGLGQIVMRRREYVVAIKPCGNGLLLETLRYADEIQKAAPYFASIDDDKPDAELLKLAGELIDRKSAPYDPSRFQDQYSTALRELIDAKAEQRKPVAIDDEPRGGAKIIDLVEALKRSVKGGAPAKPSRGSRSKAA